MLINKLGICALAVISAGVIAAAPQAQANDRRLTVETEIVRIVGGDGFGFCEFTRRGRRVSARVHIAGMDYNSVGTAWIFINGVVVGQLDGTIADNGGDASFFGDFKASRRSEVKIDVRDHRISIKTIGNTPNDEMADETLVRELTTPAPYKMGTCATTFE